MAATRQLICRLARKCRLLIPAPCASLFGPCHCPMPWGDELRWSDGLGGLPVPAVQALIKLLRMVPFLQRRARGSACPLSVRWPTRHGAAHPGPGKGAFDSKGAGGALAFFGPRVPSASPGCLLSSTYTYHPKTGLRAGAIAFRNTSKCSHCRFPAVCAYVVFSVFPSAVRMGFLFALPPTQVWGLHARGISSVVIESGERVPGADCVGGTPVSPCALLTAI